MKKGYLYIGLTTFLFSTMEIALKSVSSSFNPIQMTLCRFFIGGIILLPLAIRHLKSKDLKLTKSDIKHFSFLGFICVVVSMVFYQLAVLNTKASVVAILFSCNPIFVMFLAFFILKEPILKNNVISLVLEVIGIVTIINPFNTKLTISGILFTLLAAITFAIYGVFGKKECNKFGGLVVTCFSFILGSIEMLFLVLISKIDFISNILISNNLEIFANIPILEGYTFTNLIYVIYIFVFVTGIGYALYFKSMEETSANTTSLVFFFKPILSPILAFFILKESIPLNMIFGILFILLGSIITILPNIIPKNDNSIPNSNI